eukprot:gene12863-27128_t
MTDPTLLANVRSQLEFYFSDSNYRRDTFLRSAAESDPEGFVPITTMLKFNKLKALTMDPLIVAEAIKESQTLSVSAENDRVKRTQALPIDDTSNLRTLYVKGFPTTDESGIIETVKQIFSKYGNVLFVRLRRDAEKKFKGSCFVEFGSTEEMNAAVAAASLEGESKLTCNGTPFESVLSFLSWHEKKKEEKSKKSRNTSEKPPVTGAKRDREGGDDEDTGDKGENQSKDDAKVLYTPGLIFKITNFGQDITLFQIKDAMKPLGSIKFIDYQNGDAHAFVRVGDVETVAAIQAVIKEGFSIIPDGEKIVGTLIEGDEELAYWTKIVSESKQRDSNGGGRGGRGRGRGGGRGRGRGRGGGRGGGRKRSRN